MEPLTSPLVVYTVAGDWISEIRDRCHHASEEKVQMKMETGENFINVQLTTYRLEGQELNCQPSTKTDITFHSIPLHKYI